MQIHTIVSNWPIHGSQLSYMYRSDAVTLPDPLKTVSPNSSFSFSGSLLDLSLSDVPLGSVSGNEIRVGG